MNTPNPTGPADSGYIGPRGIMPEPTLRRLPWYLAYVTTLASRGTESVSSTAIAKELNIDASQIAKDLSFLDIRGRTRVGYDVAQLEQVLRDFLGFNRPHNAVMVGVGNLGGALMADGGLAHFGLRIVAGFDIRPEICGTSICGVEIYDIASLPELRDRIDAEIGIIAVPIDQAQEVADTLVAAGIRALWNFTPVRLRTSTGVVVTNTSIYAHLAVMYNRLATLDRSHFTDYL